MTPPMTSVHLTMATNAAWRHHHSTYVPLFHHGVSLCLRQSKFFARYTGEGNSCATLDTHQHVCIYSWCKPASLRLRRLYVCNTPMLCIVALLSNYLGAQDRAGFNMATSADTASTFDDNLGTVPYRAVCQYSWSCSPGHSCAPGFSSMVCWFPELRLQSWVWTPPGAATSRSDGSKRGECLNAGC